MEFLHSFLRLHSAGKHLWRREMSVVFSGCKNPRFVNVLFPSARVASSLAVHAAVLIISCACYLHRSQKIAFRYQGTLIFMLSLCLKVQTDPEEVKQRDLWVTDFIPMQNIYKLALALTSKEIGNLIYQFFCTMYQYRPRRRGTLLLQHLNAYRSFRYK